jgi:hypothetical protein
MESNKNLELDADIYGESCVTFGSRHRKFGCGTLVERRYALRIASASFWIVAPEVLLQCIGGKKVCTACCFD